MRSSKDHATRTSALRPISPDRRAHGLGQRERRVRHAIPRDAGDHVVGQRTRPKPATPRQPRNHRDRTRLRLCRSESLHESLQSGDRRAARTLPPCVPDLSLVPAQPRRTAGAHFPESSRITVGSGSRHAPCRRVSETRHCARARTELNRLAIPVAGRRLTVAGSGSLAPARPPGSAAHCASPPLRGRR